MNAPVQQPFEFVAASYLIRIRPERARTLGQMARYVRETSEECIFYHTFQSLETHHYSVFSSDFAQWVLAACNEAALAERLATVDLRTVVSLAELRDELAGMMDQHIAANPQSAERPAFEPFHFCEAIEITVPTETRAHNLSELAQGIRQLAPQTLHYHYIVSRLRLHLQTNDFSHWIRHNLGMTALAAQLDGLDIYTNTLDGLRDSMVKLLEGTARGVPAPLRIAQ